MQEIWKNIEWTGGDYQVSNMGNVRGRTGLLKPRGTKKYQVKIYGKNYLIHRLVAAEFCPNPHGYNEVNHKNEIQIDNRDSNLEWCTHQYNCEYSFAKEYVVEFPDGVRFRIFNLRKFCRGRNLNQGNLLIRKYSKGFRLIV